MKKIFLILFLSIGVCFLTFSFIFAAGVPQGAPTVTFSGDDLLQNGGTDDAYDSLIVANITTSQATPTTWELEYSNDGGQTWNAVIATYTPISSNENKYYWSVSKIYAPTLLFRTRTEQTGTWTNYYQIALSLAHRVTNNNAHYFVESFNDNTFQGSTSYINWDTSNALVQLDYNNPPKYHPNGTVKSNNLLAGLSNGNILSVSFQPVQGDFGNSPQYQFSNDGNSWYGSGGLNTWYTFAGQTVPDEVNVSFGNTVGSGLYWRISLSSSQGNNITPQVFQLRFFWQENTTPQACFTINPPSSNDPEQIFAFNANCSSDYEDSLNQMYFRWDFDNDGNFETAWQQGAAGYIKTNNYHSTSTFVANLEVKDQYDAVSSFTNSLNEISIGGSIAGWLWSSNYGWTSLNCNNTFYDEILNYCPPNYGWQINDDYTMSGWAWDSNLGWLCLGSTCQAYGNTPDDQAPVAVYSRNTGTVVGWGKFINYDESGWLQLRGNWCAGAEDQCVHVNISRRSLQGWAWAGGRSDNGISVGPGWVQFEGNVNVPWLETKFGSIYSRDDVGSAETFGAPQDRYNASYCILSTGNIINFSSEINCLEAGYRDLGFPNSSNNYKNILGMIDFGRILDGQKQSFDSVDIDANLSQNLAGNVYYFGGAGLNSFTIDSPLTFYNARNLNSSGAGTVVVDGDLYINSNMYYENNPVTGKISNLASIAWIVKGDVYIDPNVTNIVGNFIVLGKNGIACPLASCGNFLTGDDSGNTKQLVLQGLAMSKSFSLQRYYKNGGEPAEKFIYDGRALVNTPPGLEDFAKGMPVWREALPTNLIE